MREVDSMGPNKLVAHFKDGHVLKGHSIDFTPSKPTFHLFSANNPKITAEIQIEDLKALFFVKDFKGDPTHIDRKGFDPNAKYIGKKLHVKFRDSEVLAGIRQAFNPSLPGFFLNPIDPSSNTIRVFIVNSAVSAVEEKP
jgi:hypothetical protein